ncbi:VirK family protein [Legionella sp. CNM-4043-24]|uniref:VirK family protein n=1 Tax=Legionella sp. CNM-4043-24 TaxID=3421646 RepID=UPI00403AFB21
MLANTQVVDYDKVKELISTGDKISIVTDLQQCKTTSDADDQEFALVDDITLGTFTPSQAVIKKNGEIVTSMVNEIKLGDSYRELRQHVKFTINPDNKVTLDISFIQRPALDIHVVFVCDLGSGAKIYYRNH